MVTDIYEDTLYGQLLPVDWDDDSVSRVMLLVDGDEEFIIEPDENTDSLVENIERWVTAEGVITEEDEQRHLKVRHFNLEDDIDFEEEEDW